MKWSGELQSNLGTLIPIRTPTIPEEGLSLVIGPLTIGPITVRTKLAPYGMRNVVTTIDREVVVARKTGKTILNYRNFS